MSPNHQVVGDSLVRLTSHEQFEAITDPLTDLPNLDGTTNSGWYGAGGSSTDEIADRCATNFSAGLTQLNNNGVFMLQTEFSNAARNCVNAYTNGSFKITPSTVNVTTPLGTNPRPQTLTITNNKPSQLSWQLTVSLPSWLTVSPTSGSLSTGASQSVTVTFTMPQVVQSFSTSLTFRDMQPFSGSGPQVSGAAFLVPVTVNVTPPPLSWNIVSSPNPGTTVNFLRETAAVSATDVWAVGGYSNADSIAHTLVEHWNGAGWSVVSSPNASANNNSLIGVAAVAANNVWAVGSYVGDDLYEHTLVEHWGGTSWSIVPSPSPGTNNSGRLLAVTARSASDVWAVGSYDSISGQTDTTETLVEHWDGASWSAVVSPNPSTQDNVLSGVVVVSASDVWAVGVYVGVTLAALTLVEHWDGTSWTVMDSPNGVGFNSLDAVAAVSANDVWAVGEYGGPGMDERTLVEHWNGASWSIVPSPNGTADPVPGANFVLIGVAATSASDVWAVGNFTNGGPGQTLVEHWNGASWSVVPSPNADPSSNSLDAVAVVSASDVWAVGSSGSGAMPKSLIERYH
jgi:hypothetical protein